MAQSDLLGAVLDIISSVHPDSGDDYIEKLRFFFPDALLLAALDLIDRDSVIKYVTSWGTFQYEVLGSTATYSVTPLFRPSKTRLRAHCSCYAFAFSVLRFESQVMCKHVLATLLAERLSRCVERPATADEVAAMVVRQCS